MIKQFLHAVFGHKFEQAKVDSKLYKNEFAIIWRGRVIDTPLKTKENEKFLKTIDKIEI